MALGGDIIFRFGDLYAGCRCCGTGLQFGRCRVTWNRLIAKLAGKRGNRPDGIFRDFNARVENEVGWITL